MTLNSLYHQTQTFNNTSKMPVLFVGHGSPMNAIEDNEFTREWRLIGENIPKPAAILCISAHWETDGTLVTAMQNPRTIHDFYSFPENLFKVQYPAKGSSELATEIQKNIASASVELDLTWGLDHGSWSVIKHMYPNADIPVIEMSLDCTKNIQYHFELAKELSTLREKGILIIGSGNLVHNLRTLDWNLPDTGFEWAQEACQILKNKIISEDYSSLINYQELGQEILYSIPSAEHFLPTLYILALKNKKEQVNFFNDKVILGSLSMTSFIIQ